MLRFLYKTQWQQLDAELDCLGDEADDYRAKYAKISNQIEQWLAPKLQQLTQQQAEQAAAAEQAAKQQAMQQQLTAYEQQLQQALLGADIQAAQALEQQLNNFAAQLAQLELMATYACHEVDSIPKTPDIFLKRDNDNFFSKFIFLDFFF